MFARPAILLLLVAWPAMAAALDLQLPGNAVLNAEVLDAPGTYDLPTGPYAAGEIPARTLSGDVTVQAWRIEGQALTPLQVMTPLELQLREAGFEVVFRCHGAQCGGFDFRFGTRVLPAPDMFVDLMDYRFLSALKDGTGGTEAVTALVSRAGATGYVQIIHVAPEGAGVARVAASGPVQSVRPGADQPLARALVERGHVILSDLTFETGSAALGNGGFASLEALAEFLNADPTRKVALVGHTDAVGNLQTNIALSKRRAASVLERLVLDYGVNRAQMAAEGMGYLAPVAPNLTAEGREENRRVEAVLLNTE